MGDPLLPYIVSDKGANPVSELPLGEGIMGALQFRLFL